MHANLGNLLELQQCENTGVPLKDAPDLAQHGSVRGRGGLWACLGVEGRDGGGWAGRLTGSKAKRAVVGGGQAVQQAV